MTNFYQHSLAIACLLLSITSVSADSRGVTVEKQAEKMLAEAEQAGIAGDASKREQLIERAIRTAPDHAPIRWAAGQVQVEDGWMSVEGAQSVAASDPRQKEYEQLRESTDRGATAQAGLARWCNRAGLDDEARYHWLQVLEERPKNREALAKLNMAWKEGKLVETVSLQKAGDEDRGTERPAKYWKKRIARWQRTRPPTRDVDDPVLVEVRSITDESAIMPFERLAARLDQSKSTINSRRYQLVGAFIEALDAMPSPEATASLTLYAVLTPDKTIRKEATEALTSRPLNESVPLLLAWLRTSYETSQQMRVAHNGEVAYSHEVLAEGREANFVYKRTRTGHVAIDRRDNAGSRFNARPRKIDVNRLRKSLAQRDAASLEYEYKFRQQAEELESRVAAMNLEAGKANGRIVPVLEELTEKRFGDSLRKWNEYWTQYEGYQQYEERPTYTQYDNRDYTTAVLSPESLPPPLPPPPPYRPCECFLAGTPTWTKTGRVAIETLKAGDMVLSKDTETGELSFRAVLATTLREPSPLLSITAGDEMIIATEGHPFWVIGKGWQMAKELSVGDHLSTVSGLVEIKVIDSAPNAEAHNLIVEGNACYYVGETGMLAHDNTPRGASLPIAGR